MNRPSSLDLAVIGNCQIAALIDAQANLQWGCFPRLDGDPVFCGLVRQPHDGGLGPDAGIFSITLDNLRSSEQIYRPNSAVLETRLTDAKGQAVLVTDFAPRFHRYGRMFRPAQIVRIFEPIAGRPRLRIGVKPLFDYGARKPECTVGSNHIRFMGSDQTLRLTTDAALSAIGEDAFFTLDRPIHLFFGVDEPLAAPIPETARAFLDETDGYWRKFVRSLALPFEWQDAVIRAAITLKLSTFEDTGAIVAALTTSIPEAPASGRNWDYRFCWLRDAYFVILALNRLGATETMEQYLGFITDRAAESADGYLEPLFSITPTGQREERIAPALSGYRGMGPVRLGNAAWSQTQNDSYGAVVLAATQMFYDRRLMGIGLDALFEGLERLGHQARRRWDQPDAGLWEFRSIHRVHSFSAILCWAACDRLSRIASHLGRTPRARFWAEEAARIHEGILARAWNPRLGAFTDAFEGDGMDASLLLIPELGFLKPHDPRFLGSLAAIEARLRKGNHLMRYDRPDDFGAPETAFTICGFWYIEALSQVGRSAEARDLFEGMLASRNRAGLLSEDMDLTTGELWGNYPQTYSLVGLINAALKLSKPWDEALR